NWAVAEQLVGGAAGDGREYVLLPEMWNVMGDAEVLAAGAEPLDGATHEWASALARTLGIWLHAGSFTEQRAKHYNTSCLYSPDGDRVAIYRKIHLFDNDLPGAACQESATVAPGDKIVTASVAGVTLGLIDLLRHPISRVVPNPGLAGSRRRCPADGCHAHGRGRRRGGTRLHGAGPPRGRPGQPGRSSSALPTRCADPRVQ